MGRQDAGVVARKGQGIERRQDGIVTAALHEQDEDQALEWFMRAAELDEPEAMYQLGYMFETGIRVKKDKAKAIWYYERAAELGHRGAQSILERMAPDRTV